MVAELDCLSFADMKDAITREDLEYLPQINVDFSERAMKYALKRELKELKEFLKNRNK